MKSSKKKDIDKELESFQKLIKVMRDDPVINEIVLKMLRLDSYQRRSVINNWLEQLRVCHASANLLSAISCLFDDKISAKVLQLISNQRR